MTRVFCAAAYLIMCIFRLAEAQSNPSTPEQVVRDFFKAEQDGRWLDAAHLLDLTRFEPIRRSAVAAVRSVASRPKITPQQLMEMDPGMPLAAAEYQVQRMKEHSHNFDFLSHEFARVPSADILAALPINEAAARWLEARGSKGQQEMALEESKRRPQAKCAEVPDSIVRVMVARFRPPVTTILGATEASDSVGYVVVGFSQLAGMERNAVEPPYVEMSPSVLTLRKRGGNWRIVATPDMPHSDGLGGMSTFFGIGCSMERPSESEVPKK